MRPFVINGHGRLVFPSNFSADLDFSVLETLEQLEAVVKRDFEAKAPTGTEILERVESDGYRSRSPLLRDLAMNLVWGNRYAMTMYEKRPTRWRDLPRHRDDVFLPLLTPWEQGERKVAAVEEAWAEAPRDLGRRGRGRHLHDPVRHLPSQASPRGRAAAREADGGGDHQRSGEPHVLPPGRTTRTTRPTATRRSWTATRRSPSSSRSIAWRWCSTISTRGTWPRSRLEEVAKIGDDDFVVAFVPRSHEVLEFIRRVRPSVPRGRGRHRPRRRATGRAAAAHRRARAVRADAPPRVARGRQGRARLHERGHHPQRRLQLVADERRRHRGQDGDPRAALHRAPARAHLAAGRPRGARGRRAPARGDRRGHLLPRARARR